MLSFESKVWGSLRHAYGPADHVPRMLQALKKNPTQKAWEDVWSALCHQGTVYSATYAAIPYIVNMALEVPPDRQFDYWNFVGAVAAGSSSKLEDEIRKDIRDDFLAALKRSVYPIRRLLESRPKGRSEVIYLLAALAATVGCKGEGLVLDYLDGDEMPGTCPGCSKELLVRVETEGVFLSPEDNPGLFTAIMAPGDAAASKTAPEQLEPGSASTWLPEMATAAGQAKLASTIRTLYGLAQCPECETRFPVIEEFGRQACDLSRG